MINDNIEKVTKKYLNLENVDNTSDMNKPISKATQLALEAKISASSKGIANGVASLDSSGKVTSSQLPSHDVDVIEGTVSTFPSTGESGKIYVDINTNKLYRWSGATYTIISDTIPLGTTSSTAYRGDYGNTAYLHSQASHAPLNAQKNSDITKAEIEAKLTGYVTSHSHAIPSATESTIGGVKLYNGIGNLTDGAINQDAMTTLLSRKPNTTDPVFTGSFSQNRSANSTVGKNSHAEGTNTTASEANSHAEGIGTIASGYQSHAEGTNTAATGYNAHSEGASTLATGSQSHAEGSTTTASEFTSHAEGYYTTASSTASHAEGASTTASNYASHSCGKFNKAMTNGESGSGKVGDVLVIGNGTSSSLSNAFRVTYTGAVYGLSAFNASGADYAEYFEWCDENLNNEDRIGHFVTLDGDKIKYADHESDYILGVVSGNPCIIGNSDEDWVGRWMHDEFGRFLTREVITPVLRTEYAENEDGIMEPFEVETGETIIGFDYAPNPEYDPNEPYIERKDRKEWSAIGMMGVLPVIDDGTCQVNGYCTVKEGGIATSSKTGYRVTGRKSDNIISIIFK